LFVIAESPLLLLLKLDGFYQLQVKCLASPPRVVKTKLGDLRVVWEGDDEFGFGLVDYLAAEFSSLAREFRSQHARIGDQSPAFELLLRVNGQYQNLRRRKFRRALTGQAS
jgi:hypothetical protein